MPEELDKLRIALQQAASERGLIVFDGEPDVAKLASVAWNGDWLSFLDLAQLRRYADWIFECREAIDTVLDETEQIGQENRTLRSQEAARKLHEYAMQLAHHPRFPEATSEEKREFMASQLFPDIINVDTLGYRAAMSIARRAVLIYWWDVEPMEKVSKIERAKALSDAS